MTFTQEMTSALDGAHRRIRRIEPGEGPYPGVLVAVGESTAVWIDLGAEAAGIDWRFVGADHVAAPLDVARSAAGHGALMPWCSMRVSAFLSRRARSESVLDAGEWATLVASILRGLREVSDAADDDLAGQWWLSDEGRPLCVPGGQRSALAGAVEVLQRAEEDCADRALRRLLVGIAEGLVAGMPTAGKAEGWETELFAFAAPRALRVDVHAPERARDIAIRDARGGAVETRPHRVRERKRLRSIVAEVLLPLDGIRAGLAARFAGGKARPTRRSAPVATVSTGHRRRGVVIAGVAAAVAVVTVGMMLPDGSPSDASDGLSAPADSPSAVGDEAARQPLETDGTDAQAPDAGEEPVAVPEESTPTDEDSDAKAATDPVLAVAALLGMLDGCAQTPDESCMAMAEGAAVDPAGVLRSADAGEAVLVDDYGDIAVIRLGEAGGAEQMLVLIRQNDRWLVRDVYDVADQPSG